MKRLLFTLLPMLLLSACSVQPAKQTAGLPPIRSAEPVKPSEANKPAETNKSAEPVVTIKPAEPFELSKPAEMLAPEEIAKPVPQSGPAAMLMAQAQQQGDAGERGQAIALLERALRIEPRNGYAWLQLAKLHQAGGDQAKAEQFARRALQFAGNDAYLAQQCRELIAK